MIEIKGRSLIALGVAMLMGCISCKGRDEYVDLTVQEIADNGGIIPDHHFVGSAKCMECHEAEYTDWLNSHHDNAMKLADSSSVLGDFDDHSLLSKGIPSRFYRRNGDYFVSTQGPDGEPGEYRVVYTFGYTPLQQYIVEFPNGRYQCLHLAWDTEKREWFDLYPSLELDPSEWMHWSKGAMNWNNMCSDCHSTNVRENYDPETQAYDTRYSLINVSCEACHGPGKSHVERMRFYEEGSDDLGRLYMTSRTPPKQQVEECARCHMRREQYSTYFDYDGGLYNHYFPQLLVDGLYYPDGQILDEVYVYGSFLQSKMYANNVRCTDCHNAHSLKLKQTGNDLCLQCHLPATFETETHHGHEVGTDGAACINCHMTGRYYMGNDYRRDHSFRVPRPDLSLSYGSPNACTQCHTDKDDEWAWTQYQRLFGTPDTTGYYDDLAHGLSGKPGAKTALEKLVRQPQVPDLIRASAANALGPYNDGGLTQLYIDLLKESSPLVKGASIDALGGTNNPELAQYLLPGLTDPNRSIRIKAYYALGVMPEGSVPEAYRKSYAAVKQEFEDHMKANADFSGGRVKQAQFYYKQGKIDQAISAYREALEIDDYQNGARFSLAFLYYTRGDFNLAEQAYKRVIELEPSFGLAYYQLALLYSERGNPEAALSFMKQARQHMPDNLRVYYNLALMLDQQGKSAEAETVLLDGLQREPNNGDLMFALTHNYLGRKKFSKARAQAEKLTELYPESTQYKQLLGYIRSLE